LPNTAGCHSVRWGSRHHRAHGARGVRHAVDQTRVIGEDDTPAPDVFGLTEAARILCAEGRGVSGITTEALVVAERLLAPAAGVLMPWGAPIGSGRVSTTCLASTRLRRPLPQCAADHRCRNRRALACHARLELFRRGADQPRPSPQARDPAQMAAAFAQAVEAGEARVWPDRSSRATSPHPRPRDWQAFRG